MPLSLITCISGLGGVFFVMTSLMFCVILSSKLASALENKKKQEPKA